MLFAIELTMLTAVNSPLSLTISNNTSSAQSDSLSPLSPSRGDGGVSPQSSHPETLFDRDLSSLLDPQNYLPIPQDDIPEAFHVQLPALPALETLPVSKQRLDDLLSNGGYLAAAHLAGATLNSQSFSPSDYPTIFDLLCTRFSCLELTGNTYLAAQESRMLGDISNAFWYLGADMATGMDQDPEEYRYSEHMMPFHFRLQVIRLQSLAFADGRRGITALYELGFECREHATSARDTTEKQLWKARLQEIGYQVVNALVEMGELVTARQTLLSSLPLEDSGADARTITRLTLLRIRIGDVSSARSLLEKLPRKDSSANIIQALLYVADGKYDEAVSEWQTLLDKKDNGELSPLFKQNLAVCLLYTGNLHEVSGISPPLLRDY